jgi:4'-phosphopantetheinyl transferase
MGCLEGRTGPIQDEIHVWRATLGVVPEMRSSLETTLSAHERERAGRYLHRDDRERFVLTQCMVRDVLGCYLKSDPGELRFVPGPRGKPAVVGAEWLRFNASHSGEICVVAVAAHIDLGIDVELIRDVDVGLLAPRALPGVGVQQLAGDADGRRRTFFACWTRQEAWLKADSAGLSGLGRRSGRQSRCYSVIDLPLEDGYAAAIAYAGPPTRIVLRVWSTACSVGGDGDSLESVVHDCLPEQPSTRLSA